ncbi:TRAP transporter small permease subunit [Anaerobacillus sp. MEB173]|uniref:TRAP transporter small permease subunit n=1 Tax=Anaerobacillus sp. MEB173 TaxID=3383345 RepID=UPI003F8F8DB3
MAKLLSLINKVSEYSGKIVSFLIIPQILVVVYTVVMRYVFKMPPNWGFEVSLFLYGILIMMGGAYCLKVRAHVSVDILPKLLSPFGAKILHILSSLIIIFVCIIMVWNGYKAAWQSTLILETSIHQSAFNPQIWWFRWFIPLSAALVLLQALGEIISTFSNKPGEELER